MTRSENGEEDPRREKLCFIQDGQGTAGAQKSSDSNGMNDQQSTSPRRRLQELLAIPERQRTDAQWDELSELEISLALVNRAEAPVQGARRSAPASTNRPKSGGDAHGKKLFRKPHQRPPKGKTP